MNNPLNFPTQMQPVYSFHIGDDGRLHIKTCRHYAIQNVWAADNRVKFVYRILVAPRTVVIKRESQINKFLNGYYYTFNPDRSAAIDAIRTYYAGKLKTAEEAAKSASAALTLLDSVEQLTDINDGD